MSFKSINKKKSSKKKWPGDERNNNSLDTGGVSKIFGEFTGINKRKWKVFRVSPICNFNVDNLKFYEKNLDEMVNSFKHEVFGSSYKSKFSINKNFNLNNQCFEVLQVELIKNKSQSAYLGVFILWNGTEPRSDSPVLLSTLLVEAKAHEQRVVHSILCKLFDCDIQAVTFSFYALIYFFVKLLEIERNAIDVSQEQITLEFKIPRSLLNDSIRISLNLEDTIIVLAMVMKSLHEKYEKISVMGIIWEFYNRVLNHIHQVFNMDLMYAELQKITFPDAFLTADGQVKISSDNAAVTVLNVLEYFTPLEAIVSL